MEKAVLDVLEEIERVDQLLEERTIPEGYEGLLKEGMRFLRITREEGLFLQSLVERYKPRTILEIGMSSGYSTLFLAQEGTQVFTIEQDQLKVKLAQHYFEQAGKKNITILPGRWEQVLQQWDKKVDLLFLDADKQGYLEALQLVEPFLTEKAIVVADNVNTHKELLASFLAYLNEKYEVSFHKDMVVAHKTL